MIQKKKIVGYAMHSFNKYYKLKYEIYYGFRFRGAN